MIKEYDEKGNFIHFKNKSYEAWYEYDENDREIHYKNTTGDESFYKYDKNNQRILIDKEEFNNLYN